MRCLENALRSPFNCDHDVKHIVVGLDALGWSIRRERTLAWAICRRSLVRVGPADQRLRQDFAQISGCSVLLGAVMFAKVDPEEEMLDESRRWQTNAVASSTPLLDIKASTSRTVSLRRLGLGSRPTSRSL